ncbi:CMP/dCMP deaminase zinc-binding protein [Candidatus Terasakiella magnetica]|nr:CMP/dCMP deaminase zinc-binding protein [Candidatus Terasakiella magnetica]
MSGALKNDLLSVKSKSIGASSMPDRLSQEIIIAMVGPVGSGVTTAAEFIRKTLTQEFEYTVPGIIRPADFILAEMHRVSMEPPPKKPLGTYITTLQDAGNRLREKFHGDYLAEKVVEAIVKLRSDLGGASDKADQIPGRRAYIIDSLKNKDELDLLRRLYGKTLFLFGVFAPDDMRKMRLIDKDVADEDEAKKIINRDRGEPLTFGQMTRSVFTESDFFICNDTKVDELERKLRRYIDLVFDVGVHTPTQAESAMHEANSAAVNSACMSRQVGASIVSRNGELIAVGYNDVPKFKGGLYREDNRHVLDLDSMKPAFLDKDHRCYKWGKGVCHNETRRNNIVDKIAEKIKQSKLVGSRISVADIKAAIAGSPVESLIEFSRSIHAEMEAILSVAREGRHSIVGSTLYTTTYPCHNCARHIVAAGISTVVYIEPYDKSLAIELHNDSIAETKSSDKSHVVFHQFDGVSPRIYFELFKLKGARKSAGRAVKPAPKSALPVFRMQLDGISEYESLVLFGLEEKEKAVAVLE